jgi:hypothetical protein
VRSMYANLLNGHIVYFLKIYLEMKVPLKIRTFMWFLHLKVLLTKDNLVKRHWKDGKKSYFYDKEETIRHLLFIALWQGFFCA